MSGEPNKVQVLEQLERILRCEGFQSSPRKQKFLRHIVEQTLQGEAASLKGYAIGVDVFDRDTDFDPQLDSIVRSQARNLRRALDLYYLTEGQSDPVRIDVPKGKYVPTFVSALPKELNENSAGDVLMQGASQASVDIAPATDVNPLTEWIRRNRLLCAVLILAFLTIAALSLVSALNNQGQPKNGFDQATHMPMGPSISIAPFELAVTDAAITANRDMESLRAGLHMELIQKLSRFKDLFVMEVNSENNIEDVTPGNVRIAQFELVGTIQKVGDEIRVITILKRQSNGQILWTRSHSGILDKPSAIFRIQNEISVDVAASLGQPYNVINARFAAKQSNLEGLQLDHYLCLMDFYRYFQAKSEAEHKRIRGCLEKATTAMPKFSSAWAALSWMYADEDFNKYNLRTDAEPPFERALAAARRAVDADPENAMAYQYLSLAKFSVGDDEGFREAAEKALRLNPNDTEILADTGSILIQIENSEQGRQMVEKAIAMNTAHPPWYHGSITMYHYVRGNSDSALYHAGIYLRDGALLAHILNTAALIQNGQITEGRKAYQTLVEMYPDFPDDYETLIKVRRIPDGMYELLIGDLKIAGLAPVI